MKKTRNRPRKEGPRKVTKFQKPLHPITQFDLAKLAQSLKEEDALYRENTTARARLRLQLLKGAQIEVGPLTAYLKKVGGIKKLIIK